MPTVFAKLNLKDQKQIVILDSPESFESELKALKDIEIIRDLKKTKELTFSLAFVTTQDKVDALAPVIARKADGDAVVWFAYPKGTSTKYKCEVNRDSGWDILRKSGFDTVRQVAIDEDWSALRFRRIEFINHRAAT